MDCNNMFRTKTKVNASLSIVVALLGLGAVGTLASHPGSISADACKANVLQYQDVDFNGSRNNMLLNRT